LAARIGGIAAALSVLLLSSVTSAAEIKVLSTQATEQAYRELVPQFERATGHKVTTIFTGTLDADKRLAAREAYDLLIMSGPSIDEHLKDGKLVAGSRVDLAKSGVGVGVKAGAPKPDIRTTDALRKTILGAKSIGYSTGPSGLYVLKLFQRLGVADQVKSKLKQTATGVFVGSIIASGEVEIGFQQVSELGQYPGVDFVGPLPADVQELTVFSSGITRNAKQADAARAWVRYLTGPEAAQAFTRRGLQPG
jgi:molybdate transport system substrate-binding protein